MSNKKQHNDNFNEIIFIKDSSEEYGLHRTKREIGDYYDYFVNYTEPG
jgi:hypothetical protein